MSSALNKKHISNKYLSTGITKVNFIPYRHMIFCIQFGFLAAIVGITLKIISKIQCKDYQVHAKDHYISSQIP